MSQVSSGPSALISLDGEMTIFTIRDIATRLLEPLSNSVGIEIDLTGVTEIDSAGLQLMIAVKKMAADHGLPLRFVGHSSAVIRVLDLCDLVGFFGDPVFIQKGAVS
ncbi:STAS domain-containing protein [Gammaproteobacteria bacterium]